MQEMSVAATTGEGGQMTVNVNGQQMNVTVPAGVKEGQNFTFQVPQAAQAVGTPVVAQAAPVVAQANYTPTGIPGVQLNNNLAPNMVQGGMVAPGSGPPPGCAAGGSWQTKKARRSAPPPRRPARPARPAPAPARLAAGSPPRCPRPRYPPLLRRAVLWRQDVHGDGDRRALLLAGGVLRAVLPVRRADGVHQPGGQQGLHAHRPGRHRQVLLSERATRNRRRSRRRTESSGAPNFLCVPDEVHLYNLRGLTLSLS